MATPAERVARWWTLARAARNIRSARIWLAVGGLEEAATNARRALSLVRTHPAPPIALAVLAATVAARVDRELDQLSSSEEVLGWALRILESAPGGPQRARLLAAVLTDLGDCYRRAGRHRQAVDVLHRARTLAAAGGPMQNAATVMMLGIVAKELGHFDQAERHYAEVERIQELIGPVPAGDAAALCTTWPGSRMLGSATSKPRSARNER